MDAGDEIWNRAAMAGGGDTAREGDIALTSVLAIHSMAMSGGLLDALARATPDQLLAALAGYRWLRLDAAAEVVADLNRQIEAGALEDDNRAEELEADADQQYADVVPTDQTLADAFRARYEEAPEAFSQL